MCDGTVSPDISTNVSCCTQILQKLNELKEKLYLKKRSLYVKQLNKKPSYQFICEYRLIRQVSCVLAVDKSRPDRQQIDVAPKTDDVTPRTFEAHKNWHCCIWMNLPPVYFPSPTRAPCAWQTNNARKVNTKLLVCSGRHENKALWVDVSVPSLLQHLLLPLENYPGSNQAAIIHPHLTLRLCLVCMRH